MRILYAVVLLLALSACLAQETDLILSLDLVSDLSETPIYNRLTRPAESGVEWKEEYQYLDSIDIYRIKYLSDGLEIYGLLVKPKKMGKYPCVIFNRGGNREMSSLKLATAVFTLAQIAKEGYVVIASQYRGNGGSEGQEEFGGSDVNDVTILPEVLKEIEEADTERIGMYGWSRGGMMTYLALTKTNKVKAAIVGGAVSDMYQAILDRPVIETGVLAEMVPNYHKNKEAALEQRSAIKWTDRFPKDVPILLLHGNADWRVKSEQSLRLALKLDEHRVPYRLIIFEGGDHGLSEHREEVHEQVISWLDKYVKRGNPLPEMEYHGR